MAEQSDIIPSLINVIRAFEISFRNFDRTPELDKIFYRKLAAIFKGTEILFFVDDEYEDVDQGNPVFLLNMVLLEAESIVITESFEDWCADAGLSADEAISRTIYHTNQKSSTTLKKLLPPGVTPVPYYEIEFGTSVATALRNATLHDPSK